MSLIRLQIPEQNANQVPSDILPETEDDGMDTIDITTSYLFLHLPRLYKPNIYTYVFVKIYIPVDVTGWQYKENDNSVEKVQHRVKGELYISYVGNNCLDTSFNF